MKNYIDELFIQMIKQINSNGSTLYRKKKIQLTTSYTTIGKSYEKNNVKFMAVGDAINVGETSKWFPGEFETEERIRAFAATVVNRYQESDLGYVTEGITVRSQRYMSHLYWIYLYKIFKKLNKNPFDPNDWAQNIVTSNLYKISPADGGNPNNALSNIQLEYCKKILELDIETLKPQYIVFITCKKRGGGKVFDAFLDDIEKLKEKLNFRYVVLGRPERKRTDVYLKDVNPMLKDQFDIEIE